MNALWLVLIIVILVILYNWGANIKRVFTFWWWVLRPICHYVSLHYAHKWKFVDTKYYNARWEELDIKYSKRIYDCLESMKGIYIKTAQILAARPDIIPACYKDECSKFLSSCPAEDFEVIKKILEKEYGKPLGEVFMEFDPKPLGAASVAQAHMARLHDGRAVVVKVQYPWVEDMVYMDIANMLFCTYFLKRAAYNEINGAKHMYYEELDFAKEVENLRYFYDNLANFRKRKGTKKIRLPEPLEQYCTKYTIVMTLVEGNSLANYLDEQAEHLQKVHGVDIRKADFEDFEPPDENQIRMIRGLLSIRQRVWNGLASTANNTFGKVFQGLGRKDSVLVERENTLPVNSEELLGNLIDVMGYQMIILGRFNTDPHAGNLLLDKTGSLGLIDFGQCWEAPLEDRKLFAKLLLACLRRDEEKCVQFFKEMGFQTKNDDQGILYLLSVVLFDQIDYNLAAEILGTKDRTKMIDKFVERDDLSDFPPAFHAFARSATILRGLGLHFLCTPSLAKCWEKYCIEILSDETDTNSMWWKEKKQTVGRRLTDFFVNMAPVVFPKQELKMMLND